MIAIASLVFILVLSFICTRVASIALTLTGLSENVARFQARSALTGTGFTTNEAEKVVNHPVRRRIITWLMIVRNGGVMTIAATMLIAFVDVDNRTIGFWRFGMLILGLVFVWWLVATPWIDQKLSRGIDALLRRYTKLDTRDYAGLLHVKGNYRVVELAVEDHDWLAGRSLGELKLTSEGVNVLGINRENGGYIGAPRGETMVRTGDKLLLYGKKETLDDIDQRTAGPQGNRQHVEAVVRQVAEIQEQQASDASAAQAETPPANREPEGS